MASSCASIDIEDATQHLRDILKLDRPAGGEPVHRGWALGERALRAARVWAVLRAHRSLRTNSASSWLVRQDGGWSGKLLTVPVKGANPFPFLSRAVLPRVLQRLC